VAPLVRQQPGAPGQRRVVEAQQHHVAEGERRGGPHRQAQAAGEQQPVGPPAQTRAPDESDQQAERRREVHQVRELAQA
jgi:hypothetical protein